MARTTTTHLARLTLQIDRQEYRVRPLRGDLTEGIVIAWRLTRAGAAARYVVAETLEGPACSCEDMRYRHSGKNQGMCKHIRAMRVLGLLP